MGGSKTYVPYPSFFKSSPIPSSTGYQSAVGRCRIYPETCNNNNNDDDGNNTNEFQSIVDKAVAQSQVPGDDSSDNKKLKKKYMKQGIAMAQSYLTQSLALDTSIVDVEIVLTPETVVGSDGCIVSLFLDAGCDQIVLMGGGDDGGDNGGTDELMLQALDASRVPKERLIVQIRDNSDFKAEGMPPYLSKVLEYASTISLFCGDAHPDSLPSLETACTNWTNLLSSDQFSNTTNNQCQRVVFEASVQGDDNTTAPASSALAKHIATLSTTASHTIPHGILLSLRDTTPTHLSRTYTSVIRTDRTDKLYTTVVCSRSGEALGLVYSSRDSVTAALECGRGVYYSRSRNGLWRKGDTSGMYQILHRIDVDCDGDALRFTVTQLGGGGGGGGDSDQGPAFCHLNTYTCWGEGCGIRHLEDTLQKRLLNAPAGSYTKRLFDDGELLRDKLVEEAQELSEADTKQHVAEELADVLYFAMVKAAKAGVSIDDAVAELDRRRRKVTRRKGDSKVFRIEAGDKILGK